MHPVLEEEQAHGAHFEHIATAEYAKTLVCTECGVHDGQIWNVNVRSRYGRRI